MQTMKKWVLCFIKNLIPIGVISYFKLLTVRIRYKGKERRINTGRVASDVVLCPGVELSRGSDIRKGVQIGDYSYCNVDTIVFEGVKIGKYCSIGYRCQIGTPAHPDFYVSTSPNIYRHPMLARNADWPSNDAVNPPVLGNDVWIGSNVVILQGVKVGDGAIIGAGAIVTKDVPPYAIAVGVPAKIIRYRFDEDVIKQLLDKHWWDNSREWIGTHIDNFLDVESFLKI